MTFATTLFLLLVGHALADYPLQGDFLAKAKDVTKPLPSVPWYWAMSAHAMIHAGAVFAVTGSLVLAFCEFLLHWVLDEAKCLGLLSFSQDQIGHILCKIAWSALAGAMP